MNSDFHGLENKQKERYLKAFKTAEDVRKCAESLKVGDRLTIGKRTFCGSGNEQAEDEYRGRATVVKKYRHGFTVRIVHGLTRFYTYIDLLLEDGIHG